MSDRIATVEAVHGTDVMVVVAVTGGGSAIVSDLLTVAGASRTVLEVIVPYAEQSLADLLGEAPRQATSVATARAMARVARQRAMELAGPDAHVAGVGCTAALVSDRPKRGQHRAHVAVAAQDSISSWSVTLDKGARDRVGEDRVVADLVLRAIATTCGVPGIDPF